MAFEIGLPRPELPGMNCAFVWTPRLPHVVHRLADYCRFMSFNALDTFIKTLLGVRDVLEHLYCGFFANLKLSFCSLTWVFKVGILLSEGEELSVLHKQLQLPCISQIVCYKEIDLP